VKPAWALFAQKSVSHSRVGSRGHPGEPDRKGTAIPGNRTEATQALAGPSCFPGLEKRSTVALVHGEDRRRNVREALVAIDGQILPKLKNHVSTTNRLAATHADALRGILHDAPKLYR